MRRVHQRLADALVVARDTIEAGDPARPALDPFTYCWAFCSALDGHHRGEDHLLFPRAMDSGAGPDELLRHLDGIDAVMTTTALRTEAVARPPRRPGPGRRDPARVFGPLAGSDPGRFHRRRPYTRTGGYIEQTSTNC